MTRLEKGNWPTMNSKAIIASVRGVFERRSIKYLTKPAYQHIILHMGFIAHYDLQGFMDTYADLADFAQNLLTSEYSRDMLRNIQNADRYMQSEGLVKEYGQVYCQSVVEANQGIVELAKQYLPVLRSEEIARFEQSERAQLARLQAKYQTV